IGDPVPAQTASINFGRHGGYDAVLAQKETGEPDFDNPRVPDWPEAEFIIGNPPFIGGKDLRSKLGGGYAEALWKANPRVPKSADFVMQWWDRAALILTRSGTPLRRFGFVTTNSITQAFSRRVIQQYLDAERRLSLVYAIADHPWTKASRDAAAVRIAMTVAKKGEHPGELIEVTGEQALDSDTPQLRLAQTLSVIHSNLSGGSDSGITERLLSNGGIGSRGVQLMGSGFIIMPNQAAALGLGRREGLDGHIRPYLNGRDLLQRSRGALVIDLFGLAETEVRQRFPEVYQHLLSTVRQGRAEQVAKSPTADAKAYFDTFWLHGKARPVLRNALAGLTRFVATVETSKHRIFHFLDASILPDNMLVTIGSDDAFHLGVLSSRIHTEWAWQAGGWLGVGNDSRYSKSRVFDPFSFPDPTPEQRTRIAELAEELDATRKTALAEVPGLTMTELYNLRDKLRSGAALPPAEQDRASAARAGIVNRLHEQIDEAVAAAYGWPADLPPSEIAARLVALNAERAAEEKAGHVRWLRPDYQIPRFGGAVKGKPKRPLA
ncbi:MAG: DNA methyltransferase, partial [Croceibacterium sp.]